MTTFLLKLWSYIPHRKNIQLSLIRIFQDQFLVGVTGIIFNVKNEVLLFRHTYRKIAWSLPAGYLNAKEHPIEGLAREIEEESGLIISIDERLDIKTDRDTARLEVSYIGTYLGGEFRPSSEVDDYGFFSQTKLPLIPKNQLLLIQDALEKKQTAGKNILNMPASKVVNNKNLNFLNILKNYYSI